MEDKDFGIQWYICNNTDYAIEFYPFNTVHPVSIDAHTKIPIYNTSVHGKIEHYQQLRSIGLILEKELMKEYTTEVVVENPIPIQEDSIESPSFSDTPNLSLSDEVPSVLSSSLPSPKKPRGRVSKKGG